MKSLTLGNAHASMALRSLNRDFVNKGGASEMFAGLEMVKYSDCFQKAEMHYWQNTAKGSNAEVDYLRVRGGVVLPVEVKASTQGAMQSLWIFMRKRGLHEAVRTSLEPFGEFTYVDSRRDSAEPESELSPQRSLLREFDYVDAEAENAMRHVEVDCVEVRRDSTMLVQAQHCARCSGHCAAVCTEQPAAHA